MERLHAGWLVKSPPGKKTFGPWRLFKSKWRERYFVLYAPPSSQTIPGCCSAVLCYYDDDNLVKEYGRIDLSRCEEVLTQLESDTHHHIFALRIANKDSERTYYLAARSEDEMNEWANCLCCVLRLSGGEGISLASGFEHLFSNGDGLRSPTRCCSILTQKSGEQRRASNVPVTISKSATALNIRMSESTASNFSSNSSTPTTTTQEPSGGRKAKRSSILSVVVRPAAASMRRPTGPANPVAQSKFQTFGGRTGVQSYQPNSPLALQGLIGLPVQKSSLLPATPAASYENVTRGQDFTEHDGRWRSWETAPAAAAAAFQNVYGFDDDLQSPPTIPDRPSRSPSSVQLKDTAASHRQHYGNLSGDWLCSKSEESDDESFDPDYVLHRPSYYIADDIITTTTNNNNNNNNTITNTNNNEGAVNMQRRRTETSEEDRGDDDDYTYPNVHYPNCSPNGDLHGAPLPPAGADATAGEPFCEEDSYDFLPTCRSRESSDRTSVTRSSCDTPNQDSGVYDILPLCSFSSDETGPATNYRTSGFESSATLDLRGIVYQNDVFFRRPSTDSACAHPSLLPLDTIDDRTESILPPLPGKKVAVPKEEEEAPSTREKTRMPPPSLSRTSLRPDRLSAVVPCYINNADVLKAHRRFFDAEDVYLPMNKSRTSDSVYIQMRSPDVAAAAADCVFGNDFTGESSCDHDRVGDLPSLAHAPGQFAGEAGNDQTQQQQQQSSVSLVPIRFTANTRSFRRKEPGRRETLDAKLRISTSGQKENIELCVGDASSCCPPPIPLKKNESNNPNYVHYATLNLDSALDSYPSPLSSPTSPGSRSCFQTDTLYRQIDPEKTKALCELKKQMDDRQRYCSKFSSER